MEGIRPTTAREVVALLTSASHDELPELLARYREDPRAQVRQAVERAARRHDHEEAERERVRSLYAKARELGGPGVAVGLDEVGRGALAGPLCVGAVVLPDDPMVWGIDDSKKLSPKAREALSARIWETAEAVGIALVEPERIDEVGMARALREAMIGALEDTGVEPDAVLIDGNPLHIHPLERCVVKGDATVAPISAASIVAKVHRDHLMVELDGVYPGYHLAESKGYGSAAHIKAIEDHGLTPIHRKSFCGRFVETGRLF